MNTETMLMDLENVMRSRKGDLLFVDPDGLPAVVQDMVYSYGLFLFAVRYFDDSVEFFEPPEGMRLTDHSPDPNFWHQMMSTAEHRFISSRRPGHIEETGDVERTS